MKTVTIMVLTLVGAALCGCQSNSPRGGSVLEGEGFKIAVPTFTTEIKQGEVQSVVISLERGNYFHQDVKLQIEVPSGISIKPTHVTIKANERPDVQFRISADKGAPLSEYRVSVTGTPETGEPTSKDFTVKVVSP